jgi:hypothetical protein
MSQSQEDAMQSILNAGALLNNSEPAEAQVQEHEVDPKLEFARTVSKKMGWKPKEEFTGDPDKFEDADVFLLDRVPEKYSSMKDRVRKTGAAAEAAVEVMRTKAREEALNEIRQAAISGNADAAVAAAHKVAQNAPQIDQEVIAWRGRNPWFDADPNAAQLAVQIAQVAMDQGLDVKAQLKAVDDQMRSLTPKYYASEVKPEVREEKTQDRVAPSVQPGTRGTTTRPKDGWDSLPSDVKASLNPIAKRMAMSFPKIDEKAHRESIAKSYYKEQK